MGYNRDRRREPDINITVNCPAQKPEVDFGGHIKQNGEEVILSATFLKLGEKVTIKLDPKDSKEEHYRTIDKFLHP